MYSHILFMPRHWHWGNPMIILYDCPSAREATLKSMVSCQKSPTRHAYAWQIGPFLVGYPRAKLTCATPKRNTRNHKHFTFFSWYTVNVSASAQLPNHNKTKHNKIWTSPIFPGIYCKYLSCPRGTSHDDSVLLVVTKQSSTVFPNFAERKNMYFGTTAILIVSGPRLLPMGLCRSLYESSSVCMALRFQVWIMVALLPIWVPGAKRYARSHYTHLIVIKVFNSSLSGPRWPWIAQDKKEYPFLVET